MTKAELAAALAAISRKVDALDSRVEIWRVVVDAHRNIVARVYRGAFHDSHGSFLTGHHADEPNPQGISTTEKWTDDEAAK